MCWHVASGCIGPCHATIQDRLGGIVIRTVSNRAPPCQSFPLAGAGSCPPMQRAARANARNAGSTADSSAPAIRITRWDSVRLGTSTSSTSVESIPTTQTRICPVTTRAHSPQPAAPCMHCEQLGCDMRLFLAARDLTIRTINQRDRGSLPPRRCRATWRDRAPSHLAVARAKVTGDES